MGVLGLLMPQVFKSRVIVFLFVQRVYDTSSMNIFLYCSHTSIETEFIA